MPRNGFLLSIATRAVLVCALAAVAQPAAATMPQPPGTIPLPVRAAFEAGLFDLPPPAQGLPTQTTTSTQSLWRVPVVMVSFADDTLRFGASGFDSALFDTTGSTETGSVYDYFMWASGSRLQVKGKVVARVQLAHDKHWYGDLSYGLNFSGTPNNIFGALQEALLACHQSVDWSPYDQDRDGYVDMLWLLHAGQGGESSNDRNDMWSITSRMSGGWRTGNSFVTSQPVPGAGNFFYRIDRFSTVPEVSWRRPGEPAEIGVFCHEFGHALGLPDLYDTSTLGGLGGNVGPGNWSLMATGGYGGNGLTPEFPSHPGSWCSQFLGWRQLVRPSADTTITLTPLSRGGPVLEFWFQGESNAEHFLIENRIAESFDRSLNYEGLLLTHVDEAAIGQRLGGNRVNAGSTPGLWLVEADGDSDLVLGRNRGDAYDPFPGLGGQFNFDDFTVPPTRTFAGAITNIALHNIQRVGENVVFDLRVRSPGWQPAQDVTETGFEPTASTSPATTAVRDARGDASVVSSELRMGIPQILVRSRVNGAWLPAEQISHSSYAALDPCVALLPSGDLAVAWSDSRGGRARIFYRSRVHGVWGVESIIGDIPGENRVPSIGCDANGRVYVAWLNTLDDAPGIYFTRFLYFAPFGQPVRLTDALEQPEAPTLVTAAPGRTHVIWVDRASLPPRLMFRRFHPDTGLSQTLPLTPSPQTSQNVVSATLEPSGTLCAVWATSSVSGRELHYQRRPLSSRPQPPDSIIETRNDYLQNLALASDPDGGLHLMFDSAPTGNPQVFYKRWRPGAGWDFSSTEITRPGEGSAVRPAVIADAQGTVTVFYTGYPSSQPRMFRRDRRLDGPLVLNAPSGQPSLPTLALSAAPNPVRAGQDVVFRVSPHAAGSAEGIDLFDLNGRRVVSERFQIESGMRVARLGATRTLELASGVYFARPSGQSTTVRIVVLR